MADAPRELGMATSLTIAPPLPGLPDEVHGTLILILLPVHTRDAEDAEKTIADRAALGTPLLNTMRRATWLETNSQLDATRSSPTACASGRAVATSRLSPMRRSPH